MKIIYDTAPQMDNVTSIVASSEEAEFPATNLQNNFTTDMWQAVAGVNSATLTVSIDKGSAIAIFNTNATSATITIDGNPITLTSYHLSGISGRLWADFGPYTTAKTVVVTLTAATTVNAGILRCGAVCTFNDILNDNSEFSKDYSIELELNNGADYFRKRNIVRNFADLRIVETRANAFIFKHDIFDAVGPQPLAMRLVHKRITDAEYILFAKRVSSPKLQNIWKGITQIEFDLKEVI